MSWSYSWNLLKVYRTVPDGIITQTFWECAVTDENNNTALLEGATVFDQYAVRNNEPDPLTGVRPPFVEDPSDEEILNWIIQVHADEKRLLGLQRFAKIKLYGDENDAKSPPSRPWLEEE